MHYDSPTHPKLVEFKVKEDGMVFIVVGQGNGNARKLIEQGWGEVAQVQQVTNGKTGNGELLILKKELDVGEYSIPSIGNYGSRLLK